MKSKLGIIIQARTGASRLPNKMILPFYGQLSVLEILLQRLHKFVNDIDIIVATTVNRNDDIIESVVKNYNLNCFRGSDSDVIGRFIKAAKVNGLTKVIRICADNPFLDMESLNLLINQFRESSCDYLAFSTSKGKPTIKTHYGFWAEAVTVDALKRIVLCTNERFYHEHVTNYIYENEDKFQAQYIQIPVEVETNTSIRLTLDTIEDFKIQQEIFKTLMTIHSNFSIKDVMTVLDSNSDYYKIMESQIVLNSK